MSGSISSALRRSKAESKRWRFRRGWTATIEVVLRNGRVLRVGAAANPAMVARLAAALDG